MSFLRSPTFESSSKCEQMWNSQKWDWPGKSVWISQSSLQIPKMCSLPHAIIKQLSLSRQKVSEWPLIWQWLSTSNLCSWFANKSNRGSVFRMLREIIYECHLMLRVTQRNLTDHDPSISHSSIVFIQVIHWPASCIPWMIKTKLARLLYSVPSSYHAYQRYYIDDNPTTYFYQPITIKSAQQELIPSHYRLFVLPCQAILTLSSITEHTPSA